MKILLKNAREQKGLKTREVAQLLGIDQALISKFESGSRKPTKEQIIKLASLLEIDFETIMITWLKEKILHEIGEEDYAIKALKEAEEEILLLKNPTTKKISATLQNLLNEIDFLKNKLSSYPTFDKQQINKAIEIEFTFESNRIEGNTLSLRETALVINKGETISGKSMREHLEIINHFEAITYCNELVSKNIQLNEKELLKIHNFLLRSINFSEAGKYKSTTNAIESGDSYPNASQTINQQIESLFVWFEKNKNNLHPIILVAELYVKLYTINPFAEGNSRIYRLVMNTILMQNGLIIANLNGDYENDFLQYAINKTPVSNFNKEDFTLFIAQKEKESLERYIGIISK